MEEALLIVKQRRQGNEPATQPDFLHQTGSVEDSPKRQLREVEAAHADTIQELEKTRQLLEAQYRINLDIKESYSLTERQIEEIKVDRDSKMAECSKLLDIRAARIRKLERQLRDVAYGTRQFSIATSSLNEAEEAETSQVRLQSGENLVEIHIGHLLLTEEGLQLLGDPEPALFCTWAFYTCEMQTTEVIQSNDPDFDKTVQYVVKVDDSFLHYVNKEKMKLELFQAHGMEYKSIAACRISVRELLESQPTVPVLGQATLLSETGNSVGVVEYRMRMRVPMEQAMRLYRERAKALGYMSANQQAAADGLRALDTSADQRREAGGAHLLDVKVVRCRDLKARRPGVQPSPYCSYKFFSCEDALSPAIPNSCEPEFHFHQRLELPPGPALDKYLRTAQLAVWVIDEADPNESAYLGVAKVDLVGLSQNKMLHGTYQLLDPNGRPSGTVDVEISWHLPYAPTGGWNGQSEPLPLLAEEADQLNGVQGAELESAGPHRSQQTTVQLREQRSFTEPRQQRLQSNNRADSAVAEEECLEPKPVNIDQPSLSQSNLEQKLENTEPRTFENNFSKAAPESPRLKAKLHKEEQRQQEAQRETEQSYDGEFESEHESDDVVVEAVTGGRAVDSCSVQIFQVHLDEQCKQLHNPDLDATRCYVSFDLPGYDMEETETPLSLPTPRPGKSRSKDFDLMFNFQKRFDFSYENEYNRRLQLATILLQGQVELRFSVVCESKDEESEFFLDLAQATVPLAELTVRGQELNETSFPLLSENSAVGSIKISTDLPCLLYEVLQEFPESKRSEVQAKLSIG
ncbi:hypothetical protein BOX15_Mlig024872g1 [Macrostomum lignano]|uniref:C2 domain-containing protein n=1 Tax=Macrostomum lignano TaxID=282301 RepID=A0A267DQJ9_9PLAT|nr:hypothetical protein BOX15_Mlig024872g1 [Macrostomum lignano]